MISKVIATFAVNGFHAWSEAPPELVYLRSRHRHLFTFKLEARVGHDDRQIEFHQLQRAGRYFVGELFPHGGNGGELEFGSRSCEMIAAELLTRMTKEGWMLSAVEVWEDGECGGRVEA
jgi:hypothetical protein